MLRIAVTIAFVTIVIITVESSHKSIMWSGHHWHVRDALNSGPGPNHWNNSNVWVDSRNRLHLKISRLPDTGEWTCAELNTYENFTYGTYRWKVQGKLDHLDRNVVLGLFSYGGPDGSNEIDIEIAEWGEKIHQPNNLYYTVWPRNATGVSRAKAHKRFALSGTWTTHWFTWAPNKITFGSQHGFQDTLNHNRFFVYETPSSFARHIPEKPMPIHMNLWAFQGQPPSNLKPVEVIIHEFKFTPA